MQKWKMLAHADKRELNLFRVRRDAHNVPGRTPLRFRLATRKKKPESENEKRGKCKQYLCSIENILFFITNRARTALSADTLKSCQTISSTWRSAPIGGRRYFSGCALTHGAGGAPARGAPPRGPGLRSYRKVDWFFYPDPRRREFLRFFQVQTKLQELL